MKKLSTVLAVLVVSLVMASCCGTDKKTSTNENTCTMTQKAPYTKKYTNADFYIDGKFQGDVALKSYEDMLAYYNIKMSKFMRDNLWITDFELGDFENVGMGGLFWVNDAEHNYFGHEIFLLPNQMIGEHAHVPTEFAAKFETWLVRNGSCYNYSVGEVTPNGPKLPASQAGCITATEFIYQNEGDVVHLKEVLTKHFIMAGDNGAVITEFASYHDGNGLRFTNDKIEFTDILTKN